MNGSFLLTKISQFSVLIPLVPALLYYKRFTTSFKILSWYIVLAVLTEIAAAVSNYYSGNNIYIAYVFFPLEFILFFFIFYQHLQSYRLIRWFMLILLVLMPVSIISDLYVNGFYLFNANTRAYTGGIITLMVLLTIYTYFKSDTEQPHQESLLWLYAGTLIYFTPNFLIFSFMNDVLIREDEIAFTLFKDFHSVFNIIYYLFYTVAFLSFIKPKKV